MTVDYPETAALPEGQSARHNPAGVLSSAQKRDATAAAAALAQEKSEQRKARSTAAITKVQATYNGDVVVCGDCGAKFQKLKDGRPPDAFFKHQQSSCGRFAARVERKREHDAGTIRARVKLHDDDLADEAELAEEQGLDLITATFTSSSFGWSLGDANERHIPSAYRGLQWSAAASSADIPQGAFVRIQARRFGEAAVDDFGTEWDAAHYYGRVVSKSGGTVSVQYDDATYPSHFTHLEIGVSPTVALAAGPAVVQSLSADGAARRQIVHVGCQIVSVGDVSTMTLASAEEQLRASAPSDERPVTVVLRRPPPKPASWRGAARSAAHRRPPYEWHPSVVQRIDQLLEDPRFARRSNAVYEALKVDFGHATENGKCLLPALKHVEARMLTAFKKKQQAKRDAAQDAAARALAAAAAGDVPDESADDDDELIADDNANEEPEEGTSAASADTAESAGSAATGPGNGGVGGGTEPSEEDAQYAALDGSGVAVLRARLRENDQEALATVKQSDLPPGTASAGPAKSAAVKEILRRRLARVLVES